MRIVEYSQGKNPIVHEITRDKKGKRIRRDFENFRPYFYVRKSDMVLEDNRILRIDDKTRYLSIDGIELKKIVVRSPRNVIQLREKFEYTWEADIPFVDRFRLDKPKYKSHVPKTCFYDIETLDVNVNSVNPIISIATYDNYTKEYLIFIWHEDFKEHMEVKENYIAKFFDNEKSMLLSFVDYIKSNDPDIMSGWYCLPSNTIVETKNGMVEIQDINEGDELIDGGNVVKKVYTGKKNCIRLKTSLGFEFETSREHRFLTKILPEETTYLNNSCDNYLERWEKAEELNRGDIIIMPFGVYKNNTGMNFDLHKCYLMGLIYGDGTLKDKWRFGLYNKNLDYIKLSERHYWWSKGTYQTTFLRKDFEKESKLILNAEGTKKQLNYELLSQLSIEEFGAFVAGWFDSDGNCYKSYNGSKITKQTIQISDSRYKPETSLLFKQFGVLTSNYSYKNNQNILHFISAIPEFWDSFNNFSTKHGVKTHLNANLPVKRAKTKKKHFKYNFSENFDKIFIKIKNVYKTNNELKECYDIETTTNQFSIGCIVHNSNDFDLPYIINRLRRNRIDPSHLSPLEYVNPERPHIKGRVLIDLLQAYRKVVGGGLDSYALNQIAKTELGYGKTESQSDISTLWYQDVDRLIEYNVNDVKMMVELDEKLKIIDFFDMMSEQVNASMQDVFFNTKVVDMYILKTAKDLEVILPSKIYKEKNSKNIKGAIVFEPQPGLKHNVAVFDLKSLYPSIISTFNLSPETVTGLMEFKKDIMGLMPYALRHLFKKREQLKKEGSLRRQRVVKEIMNTFYGATLFRGFRLQNPAMGETITAMGRKVLKWTREVIKEEGYNVVYGDSVSGNTPIPIRRANRIDILPIEDLYLDNKDGRCEVDNTYVMSDNGWTKIKYVYRHKTDKNIYSVNAYGGRVDCTEDHSLVVDGKEVKPLETDRVQLIDWKLNEYLVESEDKAWLYGFYCAEGSMSPKDKINRTQWGVRFTCSDKFILNECQKILLKYGLKSKVYDKMKSTGAYVLNIYNPKKAVEFFKCCHTKNMDKKVPKRILNSNIKTKKAFYDGYFDGDGSNANKGRITELDSIDQSLMAGIVQILKDMGESLTISIRKDKENLTRCRINKNPTDRRIKPKNKIRTINKISNHSDYVYDIETENHHFVGGVGSVLLHNTDSVFVESIKEQEAKELLEIINSSYDKFVKQFNITNHLLSLELEYICDSAYFVSAKKRYAVMVDNEIKITGFEAKRSNIPRYGRLVQKGLLEIILKGAKRGDIEVYIKDSIEKIRKINLEEIAVPASITKPLSDYKTNTMHLRAVKYSNRNLGTNFNAGSKILLIFIKNTPRNYPKTDVLAIEFGMELPNGFKIDYKAHEDRCVYMLVNTVLGGMNNINRGVSLDDFIKR